MYPMDFYAADGGTWTVNYGQARKSGAAVSGSSLSKEERRRLMREKLQRMKQKRKLKSVQSS